MGIFRRIPMRLPVAYAAVMILLFGLMLDFRSLLPGRDQGPEPVELEPAVSAMSRLSGGQVAGNAPTKTALTTFEGPGPAILAKFISLGRSWLPGTEFLKGVLSEGVPLMSMLQKPARPREPVPVWRRAAETFGYWVSGIDAGDPLTLLASQIPVLIFNPPSKIVEAEPESKDSFDPIGWFWGPRRRDPNSSGATLPSVVLGQGPVVAFYNTHAYESYLSEMSARPAILGDITTWNNQRNIVRVAQEIARTLFERHHIPTVHSPSHHNQEGQALSYKYSRLTAERILKEHPTVRVLADIHRDSAERGAETVVEIKGQKYARVMLVVAMGDADSGLPQPHAAKSLAFAHDLFKIMEQKYPGLGRQVLPKKARYNQDLVPGSTLIEIGGPENSLDEALNTARAMADVIAEAIRTNRVP